MDDSNTGLENQGDLGDVKIDHMIKKYGAGKQSKGLAALLNIGEPIVEPQRLNQEIIENRFDRVENQINDLKSFHEKDKRLLVSLVSATLVIGLLLGNLLTASENKENPIVVNNIQTPQTTLNKNTMVTKKFVNLRAKNSPKAKKLTTISPAQTVEVLNRKGSWVQVNYHNNLTGKSYKGFVWDEYLTGIK